MRTIAVSRFGLSVPESGKLTVHDFFIYQRAFELKRLDDLYMVAQQAWLNQAAKATKKNGRPVYKKFSDFFDYETEFYRIMKGERVPMSQQKISLAERNRLLNARKEKDG